MAHHLGSVQNPSVIPLNPGWLRTGFPRSWTFIIPKYPQYIKGSIFPELIINQQGLWITGHHVAIMWRFPKMVIPWGTPSHHPFDFRIFHEINHPASLGHMTQETTICLHKLRCSEKLWQPHPSPNHLHRPADASHHPRYGLEQALEVSIGVPHNRWFIDGLFHGKTH